MDARIRRRLTGGGDLCIGGRGTRPAAVDDGGKFLLLCSALVKGLRLLGPGDGG